LPWESFAFVEEIDVRRGVGGWEGRVVPVGGCARWDRHSGRPRDPMSGQSASELVSRAEAVVFDLFHTLTALEVVWSSGPMTHRMLGVSQEQWNEQLLEKSRDRLIGREKDPAAIIRRMAHAIDPGIPEERIQAAVANRVERFRGALVNVPRTTLRVLRQLRDLGKKLGLISNADVMEAAAWPDSPLVGLFDTAVFSCDVGCVKPEREIYEICMQRLRVGPAGSVFVGDGGSRELEGARAVGMTTMMITGIAMQVWPDKIEERKRHADCVIERLEELLSPLSDSPGR